MAKFSIPKVSTRALLTALFIVGIFFVVEGIKEFLPVFDTGVSKIVFGFVVILVIVFIMRSKGVKKL